MIYPHLFSDGIMENVCGLHVTQVADALASQDVHRLLIIDCRSFMSFNKGRIVQSINIHCPPILKRRSGGFISLENIVPCERRRGDLQDGLLTDVVIYDENTVHLNQAPKDSNLLSVVKSLLKQVVGVTIRYIIGGYEAVCEECPALCARQDVSCFQDKRGKCGQDISGSPSFMEPTEILPHLYLGNEAHSSQKDLLKRLGITALINASTSQNHFEDHFQYMNISIADSMNADILSSFSKAIDFIDDVAKTNGKVMVHCWAGISRSATVCIAYIMQKQKLSLDEAFEFVMSRRSVIDPNINFIQQLQKFETLLKRQNACQASSSLSQLPKSPAPWSSPTPVFSFPPVNSTTLSSSSTSTSTSLSPSINPANGSSSLFHHHQALLNQSPNPNIAATSPHFSFVPFPHITSRCSSSHKEPFRPTDLDLSPSSLSQTAASPSPLTLPSRPMSLPLVQLNSPQPRCRRSGRSVGGGAAADSNTEILVGSTIVLSPNQASPLLEIFPQLDDDVAMGTPVGHPSSESGREFAFFAGELTCPDVTLPLGLSSPRYPVNRSAATRRESPSGMFPTLNKPRSPISPLEVPVSPLPLYGQPFAFG